MVLYLSSFVYCCRIDLENGQIYMNKDTPSGLHEFTAKVWDFRRFTTINATATVAVTVEEITDQAVYSSGSLRFTGTGLFAVIQ